MKLRLLLSPLPAVAVAALLVLVMSAASGDASADGKDAGAADASARDTGPAISKIPPDPTAMAEQKQWVYDLRWDRGDIYLLEVHQVDMGAPHVTPRVMGRFALELFEGPTLIERVRFDFPMLGADEPADAGRNAPARFEPKLRTRIGVLFPATKRGTKLELWDRARNVRMPLPWPPTEGPVSADAGVN